MGNQSEARWRWWGSFGLFLILSFVNAVLMGVGVGIRIVEYPCTGPVSPVWFWVFAFPVMLATELKWQNALPLLIGLNPWLYGALWWLSWEFIGPVVKPRLYLWWNRRSRF
jgi:hypothetical protein